MKFSLTPYNQDFNRINTFRNAMVGCDASGLELRLLAHWLGSDDHEMAKVVEKITPNKTYD